MEAAEDSWKQLETAAPEVIVMMMKTAVGWHIELEFDEDDNRTRAAALVRLPDGSEVRAHGYASRHPSDSNQPRVGEEVAGARALNELAMKLLTKAHDEIDEASGRTSYPLT
ncbi:hypothetical protein GCM10010306_075990 [Streptomyces umbrinus]|nr:hypothetical protein GCM10010306_075990 [Streptomyces umbrinus]